MQMFSIQWSRGKGCMYFLMGPLLGLSNQTTSIIILSVSPCTTLSSLLRVKERYLDLMNFLCYVPPPVTSLSSHNFVASYPIVGGSEQSFHHDLVMMSEINSPHLQLIWSQKSTKTSWNLSNASLLQDSITFPNPQFHHSLGARGYLPNPTVVEPFHSKQDSYRSQEGLQSLPPSVYIIIAFGLLISLTCTM